LQLVGDLSRISFSDWFTVGFYSWAFVGVFLVGVIDCFLETVVADFFDFFASLTLFNTDAEKLSSLNISTKNYYNLSTNGLIISFCNRRSNLSSASSPAAPLELDGSLPPWSNLAI